MPVRVLGLSKVVAVAGGGAHSLALKSDGTVWAWGLNNYGQLGNGGSRDTNAPVQVTGLTGVVAVAAGGYHNLAVKSDGTVWAWGDNDDGELGNGANVSSDVPVRVAGLANVVVVAGGHSYSLAVKSDGTVWAWGTNTEGQLGNGTNAPSNLPVQVWDLSGVLAVSAAPGRAGGHNLALKSDGTVWAWGNNASGQLGNGGNGNSNVPVQVPGLQGAVAVSAGGSHSLAILARPPVLRASTSAAPKPAH